MFRMWLSMTTRSSFVRPCKSLINRRQRITHNGILLASIPDPNPTITIESAITTSKTALHITTKPIAATAGTPILSLASVLVSREQVLIPILRLPAEHQDTPIQCHPW